MWDDELEIKAARDYRRRLCAVGIFRRAEDIADELRGRHGGAQPVGVMRAAARIGRAAEQMPGNTPR